MIERLLLLGIASAATATLCGAALVAIKLKSSNSKRKGA